MIACRSLIALTVIKACNYLSEHVCVYAADLLLQAYYETCFFHNIFVWAQILPDRAQVQKTLRLDFLSKRMPHQSHRILSASRVPAWLVP